MSSVSNQSTRKKRKVIRRRLNYPKRAPTAYMLFCAWMRDTEKKSAKDFSGESLGDKSKRHSSVWKSMVGTDKRAMFEKKAATLKAAVQKKRAKINKKKPKRPLNAYFRFKKDNDQKIERMVSSGPNGGSVTNKGKIAGDLYRSFVSKARQNPTGSEAQKLRGYEQKYKDEFKKYQKAMKKFNESYPLQSKKARKAASSSQSTSKISPKSKSKGGKSKRSTPAKKRKRSASSTAGPSSKRSKA